MALVPLFYTLYSNGFEGELADYIVEAGRDQGLRPYKSQPRSCRMFKPEYYYGVSMMSLDEVIANASEEVDRGDRVIVDTGLQPFIDLANNWLLSPGGGVKGGLELRWGYVEMVLDRFFKTGPTPFLGYSMDFQFIREPVIVPAGYTVARLSPPQVIRPNYVESLQPGECDIGEITYVTFYLNDNCFAVFPVFTTFDRAWDICVGHACINPTTELAAGAYAKFYKAVVETVIDVSFFDMRDSVGMSLRVDSGHGGYRSVIKTYRLGEVDGYYFVSDPLDVIKGGLDEEKALSHYMGPLSAKEMLVLKANLRLASLEESGGLFQGDIT